MQKFTYANTALSAIEGKEIIALDGRTIRPDTYSTYVNAQGSTIFVGVNLNQGNFTKVCNSYKLVTEMRLVTRKDDAGKISYDALNTIKVIIPDLIVGGFDPALVKVHNGFIAAYKASLMITNLSTETDPARREKGLRTASFLVALAKEAKIELSDSIGITLSKAKDSHSTTVEAPVIVDKVEDSVFKMFKDSGIMNTTVTKATPATALMRKLWQEFSTLVQILQEMALIKLEGKASTVVLARPGTAKAGGDGGAAMPRIRTRAEQDQAAKDLQNNKERAE